MNTQQTSLSPLGVTTKEAIAAIRSEKFFYRALSAGWIKPHIKGKGGRRSIFNAADVEKLFNRLGRELPPLLPYEKKKAGFTLLETMGAVALVLVLSAGALLAFTLNRCTAAETAFTRECQILNAAYQNYIAAGGNALAADAPTAEAYAAVTSQVNGVGPFLIRHDNTVPTFQLCSGPESPTWTVGGFGSPTPTPTPSATPSPSPTATPSGSATPTPTATPLPTATPTPTPTPLPMVVTLISDDTVDQGDPITITADVNNPNSTPQNGELTVSIPSSFMVGALSDGWTYNADDSTLIYRTTFPGGPFSSPPVTVTPLSPEGEYSITAAMDNYDVTTLHSINVRQAFSSIGVDTTASPQNLQYGQSGTLDITISNPNPASQVAIDIPIPNGIGLNYLNLPFGWTLLNSTLRFDGTVPATGSVLFSSVFTGNEVGSYSLTASSRQVGVACPDGTLTVVGVSSTSAIINVDPAPTATPIPSYSVTFNGNGNTGGDVPTTATYHAGDVVTFPTGPTKTNYSFLNWTATSGITETDINRENNSFVMPTQNVSLQAAWSTAKYTLKMSQYADSANMPFNTGQMITVTATAGGPASITITSPNAPIVYITKGTGTRYDPKTSVWPSPTTSYTWTGVLTTGATINVGQFAGSQGTYSLTATGGGNTVTTTGYSGVDGKALAFEMVQKANAARNSGYTTNWVNYSTAAQRFITGVNGITIPQLAYPWYSGSYPTPTTTGTWATKSNISRYLSVVPGLPGEPDTLIFVNAAISFTESGSNAGIVAGWQNNYVGSGANWSQVKAGFDCPFQ